MSKVLERETAESLACGLHGGATTLTFANGESQALSAAEAEKLAWLMEELAAGRVLVASEMLSPAQAAKLLGVSRPTIYKWIDQGLLADVPVGADHRIPLESAQTLYQERTRRATEAARLLAEAPDDPRVVAARDRAAKRRANRG